MSCAVEAFYTRTELLRIEAIIIPAVYVSGSGFDADNNNNYYGHQSHFIVVLIRIRNRIKYSEACMDIMIVHAWLSLGSKTRLL